MEKTGRLGLAMLRLLEILHLVDIKRDKDGIMKDCNNLTLINLVLIKLGPMREDWTCISLMFIQFCAGILTFAIRFAFSAWWH